jgi:hypothetical protein
MNSASSFLKENPLILNVYPAIPLRIGCLLVPWAGALPKTDAAKDERRQGDAGDTIKRATCRRRGERGALPSSLGLEAPLLSAH